MQKRERERESTDESSSGTDQKEELSVGNTKHYCWEIREIDSI